MTDLDRDRLKDVHPYVARRIEKILNAMFALGWPMFVVSGLRTDDQQRALYAQGRTKPGSIVTNVDGTVKKSMHQRQATGYGHAVDLAFVDDPITLKIETWDVKQPWQVYGTMAEAYGLTWGGRWTSIVDRPHVELSLSSPYVSQIAA